MRNIGRMDCLAFELVIKARCVWLERQRNVDDTLWKTIQQKLGIDRTEICVGIATAPHKMRLKHRNGLHKPLPFLLDAEMAARAACTAADADPLAVVPKRWDGKVGRSLTDVVVCSLWRSSLSACHDATGPHRMGDSWQQRCGTERARRTRVKRETRFAVVLGRIAYIANPFVSILRGI